MDRIDKKKGFTLIETILYVALAGAVSVVLIQTIDLLQSIRTRHIVAAEVNGHADWAMHYIGMRLESHGPTSPAVGAIADELELEDSSTILVVDGQFIRRTATDSVPITGDEVIISSVSFENLGTGTFDIIRATFTASFAAAASGSPDFIYSKTYETSIAPLQ